MEITWHGHSCFRLVERGKAVVVTDPYDGSIGYAPLRLTADIVTVSHTAPGHSCLDVVGGRARPITGPGEYEIGEVFITGIATTRSEDGRGKKADARPPKRNTLYVFDFDALTVCHLGDLDHVPTQSQIEALGSVDVALVPVGGGGGLNASQAAEVVSLLEPSIVVPMHFKTPDTHLRLDPVDRFLKEMGLNAVKDEPLLKISKSSLPDEVHVVLLDYKTT